MTEQEHILRKAKKAAETGQKASMLQSRINCLNEVIDLLRTLMGRGANGNGGLIQITVTFQGNRKVVDVTDTGVNGLVDGVLDTCLRLQYAKLSELLDMNASKEPEP